MDLICSRAKYDMATKIKDILKSTSLKKAPAGSSPYLEIGDVNIHTKKYELKSKPSVSGAVFCPKNVVIVSKVRPNRGAVSLTSEEIVTSSAFVFLDTDSEKCLPEYLFYSLAWNNEFFSYLSSKATGATYPTVKEVDVLNYSLGKLPSIKDQQQLIKIFKDTENLKEKRILTNKKMDELLPSLFVQMFGDPEAGTSKFPVVDLNTVCLYVTDGTHQPPKFTNSGIPFLFVKNIVSGKIDFDTEKYISEEIYQDLTKKYKPKVGNILYSTVGSYGVAVEIKEDRKFSFQRHIGHISPDISKINPTFLCAQLNTPFVKKQADLRARGVAQKTVNLQEIKKFKLVLPPIELQNKFTKLVEEIELQKNKQKESTQKVDELFNAVMAKSSA